MVTMASRGIRHLPLVDEAGRLSGVISERDLFALQQVSLGRVRRAIESAGDVAALQQALREVRQAAFHMLAQGVGSEQVTQFISTLNDAVTNRVLALTLRRHPLDDLSWAWLAFGSEGREEQTFFTDQDNGLVFVAAPGPEREAARARLLAFATDVNADLDRCGFPLCQGGIMAGNPKWCLSLDEWKARFSEWVSTPHPEALLHATIFFDFRAVSGRAELAARLHEHLLELCRGNEVFLRQLAGSALTVAPPLGLFRDFVTERDEQGQAFIDLKKYGSRLFVDAARVLALAHEVDAASTLTRLRRTAKLPGGAGEEVDALADAFNFLQLLRLRRQQLEAGLGHPGDNRVFVDELNQLDRRILKAAFGQAKNLQLRLKLTYQL
jgi:CBS domain-containing protein